MLDAKTLKVLEFLDEHPNKWYSVEELCENGVPADWETLKWMQKRESVRTERRANIAIGISLLSLLVSVITTLKG